MNPITIVLTEGFSDWEIAPLAGAGRAFYGADIRFVSPKGGALSSAAGLPIAETAVFKAPESGVVVVCGGPLWEGDSAPDITATLNAAKANGCTIAGICGGTVSLARGGLLDNVAHTSNALEYLTKLAPAYTGSAHYKNQPSAVHDAQIITAPAPAPASFAAEVLVAAGYERGQAMQIKGMLAQEHVSASDNR